MTNRNPAQPRRAFPHTLTLALSIAPVACGEAPGQDRITAGPGLTSETDPTAGSDDTGADDGATGDSTGADTAGDTAGACDPDACDGTCVGDLCCEADLACGDVCCDGGQVCSFQQCVVPGDTCIDASECPEDNYCEYSLGEPGEEGKGGMCQGGTSLATGKCLPAPPECPPGVEPDADGQIDCLPECEVIPESSFAPELKYHWSAGNSMMAPIVVPLDDDNCDAIVDERDIPEIVFATFVGSEYNADGTLHAISIVDGAVVEKWSAHPLVDRINPGRSIAGGDIDATPGNEIVVCTDTGKVRAFDHDGAELWTSVYASGCFMPSIADLDGDGQVEIVVEAGILDGATGALEASFPGQTSVFAADIDLDGVLEIVGPHTAYELDGSVAVASGLTASHPAIADFDLDGAPEIAAIDTATHTLHVWRWTAGGVPQVLRQGIDINHTLPACDGNTGGGPPTVADFNGDGTPDVGVAAGVGYAVIDGADIMNPAVANPDTLMWITPATDCSSRQTGSSVFDFDGDGSAEVVYGDEQYLRIYDGTSGDVLFQTCNTTGTLWEYPLVADVDNDSHADIVVISNNYSSITCPDDGSKQNGVRVFGDQLGKWVRTRRIWNQHPYHVTNVEEDGSIPATQELNWTVPRLNNFRQNVQPEGEFSAPDLVVSVLGVCAPTEFSAIARVRNLGRAAVDAGVPVGFYEGDPAAGGTLIGTGATTKVLYPAEAEDVVLELNDASATIKNGDVAVWAVVDDGGGPHPWQECRTENNAGSAEIGCDVAG
jgi:hypothetical protein